MDPMCEKFGLSEFGCNAISPGLYFGYVLLGIALIAAIVLPLMNTLKNPGVLVKSGISLAGLAVLFIISFFITDGSPTAISKGFNQSEFSVRLISAGLVMFYLSLSVAAVGVIYSEINKALK